MKENTTEKKLTKIQIANRESLAEVLETVPLTDGQTKEAALYALLAALGANYWAWAERRGCDSRMVESVSKQIKELQETLSGKELTEEILRKAKLAKL